MAASRTVRAIGPAVSWECEMGMIPVRPTRPTVGLIPTIPQAELGQSTDPSVSVPIATAQRLAATAAPEPELEPQGLRSSTYGLFVCPPPATPSAGRTVGTNVGPFAEIGFAEQHSACGAQTLDNECI